MSAALFIAGVLPMLKRPLLASARGILSRRVWASGTDASFRDAFRASRCFSALPGHVVLTMPALSPTMSQGNVAKWHVKEGDEVSAGTVLADIETDKATLAYENQDDGFVARILVPDGAKDIPIGTPVLVLAEEKADIAAFANFSPGPAPTAGVAAAPPAPANPSPAPAASAAASTGKAYPPHTPLTMPALSPTMERGNIVGWKVKVGDEIKPGDLLAEIETDKATLGFENQEEGFLAAILMPDGSKDVAINSPIAIIVEEKELVHAFADYTAASASASPAPPAVAPAAATPAASASAAPAASRVPANHRIGPAARMALELAGLSSSDISTPSGPNGIITKGDVMAAVAAGVKPGAAAPAPKPAAASASSAPAAAAATPAPAAPAAAPSPTPVPAAKGARFIDTPNSQIRKVIAKRLLESKVTIPGLYCAVDARLDALATLRTSLQSKGTKLSVNDFVLKAVAAALKEVPEANVYWDDKEEVVKRFVSIDICVAVATDRGLITPIVKDAGNKTIQQISKDVKSLALKARENKLKPEEFMGGSFTVSNLGMYGVSSFNAIINPPQAGIIAVGGSQQKTVLDKEGQPQSQTLMTLSLSADHRVYDGALAAALLNSLKTNIESPVNLLM